MEGTQRFKYVKTEQIEDDGVLQQHINRFEFMGREKLKEVYDRLEAEDTGLPKVLASGGSGNGKSYILAALAVHYMAIGRKVIYIPDCSLLDIDIQGTLLRALMMMSAKPHDVNLFKQLDVILNVEVFLKRIKQQIGRVNRVRTGSNSPLFILDQYDEVKNPATMNRIRGLYEHAVCLVGMSANCPSGIEGTKNPIGFDSAPDFKRGFTTVSLFLSCFISVLTQTIKAELEAWWDYYRNTSSDYKLPDIPHARRQELYELTGSSPLILSILFRKEYENLSADEVVAQFTDPSCQLGAFRFIRTEMETFLNKKNLQEMKASETMSVHALLFRFSKCH